MADFKTAPGVTLNETECTSLQMTAEFCKKVHPGCHVDLIQHPFRLAISRNLDISLQDAQVFTLC